MPRFTPDLTKARANVRIFDRGDYEIKVTKATPFINEGEDDKGNAKTSAGCYYSLEMVGKLDESGNPTEEFRGEFMFPQKCYVHTDKAWGMTKQFLMAALGYARDEEDKFDAEWASKADLSLDGDADEVVAGKSWEDPVGKHVRVTLDKRLYQGNEQQDFRGWTPAGRTGSRGRARQRA